MSVRPSQQNLSAISEWVDDSYPAGTSREAHHWRRIAKVTEEAGEVTEAFLGYLGENPRKGVTHTLPDVIEELLDVAIAALGAVEHLTANCGDTLDMLDDKIAKVATRAGVAR